MLKPTQCAAIYGKKDRRHPCRSTHPPTAPHRMHPSTIYVSIHPSSQPSRQAKLKGPSGAISNTHTDDQTHGTTDTDTPTAAIHPSIHQPHEKNPPAHARTHRYHASVSQWCEKGGKS
mmetsp:Transcript_28513/g.71214  ORF Transcript_28513/g.71214 Transcript_28513/m.71214 type:complete len:118 (-) Transcript_28513:1298-1651(-)